MAHINLLPWRDSQRAEQKRQYLTMLAGIAIVGFGLMFGVAPLLKP